MFSWSHFFQLNDTNVGWDQHAIDNKEFMHCQLVKLCMGTDLFGPAKLGNVGKVAVE